MNKDHRYTTADPTVGLVQLGVFPARPQCMLIVGPSDASGTLRLPPLTLPFTFAGVGTVLGDLGCTLNNQRIPGRAYETMTGQFGPAIERAIKADREARIQAQKRHARMQAVLLSNSNVASVRDRSQALLLKNDLDARLRQLKAERDLAGRHVRPELAAQIEKLTGELLVVTQRLSEFGRAEKERKMAASRTFSQRFVDAAKQLLDPETFGRLMDEARAAAEAAEALDDGDDDAP